MTSTTKILRYAVTAAIIILVAGLAGWYFFLNKKGQAITETDTGRGLNSAPPSFGADTGSTYNNIASDSGAVPSTGETGKVPRLWHITKTPVAGMGFVATQGNAISIATTSPSQLYFAERGTGYILKADPSTGSLTRFTNKLLPRVYEAMFTSLGAVVLRSLDDAGNILSFAGEAPKQDASESPTRSSSASAGTATLSGNYLDRNIRAIVPYPGTNEFILLVPNVSEGVDVVLSSWDGAKQKTLFSSPLSGWKLFSLSDGGVFLSSLPADDTAGYAFEIQRGVLVPRVRDILGLTFLPRSSSDAVLFSQSGGGDVSLFASLKKDTGILSLPIKTVADKCVWAPRPIPPSVKQAKTDSGPLIAYCAVPDFFPTKNFLSDWYMGTVHTSDSWWRIDASTGEVTPVLQSGDTNQTFDVENPMIDSDGTMIAFMDAQDKSLWLLQVNTNESKSSVNTSQL